MGSTEQGPHTPLRQDKKECTLGYSHLQTTAANTNRAEWEHRKKLSDHLPRLSTPPQLLGEPRPSPDKHHRPTTTGQVSRNEAATEQLNHNPKYTHPTIPNLKKQRNERESKKKACSQEQQERKKGRKQRKVQKYLQEGRKVKERKCERSPIPRPPDCRRERKDGCAIAALYVS